MFCTSECAISVSLSSIHCGFPMVRWCVSDSVCTGHNSSAICSQPCPDDAQERKQGENNNIIINVVMETTTKGQFLKDLL